MNTKFSFAVLIVAVAVITAACAPAITDRSQPADQASEHANKQAPAIMPVTGGSTVTAPRQPQQPRLWSGGISGSDSGSPDQSLKTTPASNLKPADTCGSEDSLNQQQSGCTE